MAKFLRLLPVALALLCLSVLRAALPFPQDGSDLRPDPTARFGVLPNGLRYVIYPNHEPRNRASLRLLVLSGSLEEKDDQLGLAHFLEHMAFNGSAHYPPGTLVEYFQRLGMSFGGDTNAYTSYDHTAYQIELPDTRPATVAEGLRVFADMAGSLLLRPDMIAKERPIILSEKRTRDSVEYREFVASFDFLLPDSLLPKREPIGSTAIITGATRPLFTDLYNTWYRPERMVAIVVGDIDPAAVAPQIAAAFGPVADRAPARPDPNLGTATAALGLRTGYHAEPEAPETEVSIDVILPYRFLGDSARIRLAHLRRDLAVAMLNRRLEILSKKAGVPFIHAEAEVDESFRFVHDAGINVTCDAGQWRGALGVAEQELRRALQYGFSAGELRIATANARIDLQQAAAAASTRRSPQLADGLVDQLVDGTVLLSPADELALLGPALDRIAPAECTDALRLAFGGPGRFVFVTGNARIDGDASAAIREAYAASRSVAVVPPAAESHEGFAYTGFGPPGRIVSERHIADLDLTEADFANGVRVNLKRTPFEADRIRLRVRVGGGLLTAPKDKPALALFTEATFAAGGLGRHSADDLNRVLAGHTVGLDFKVGDDAFEFTAATTPADLLLQLQLLAAYITDPGYRPEAMRVVEKELDAYYLELGHTVDGPLESEIPRWLADGDPRFGLPTLAVARGRTLDEERVWLAPQWARGPIEIALAGDLDPKATLDALARTLGALPTRDAKPAYAAERAVHFPAQPFNRHLSVPTEIPKAVIALYWPTTDWRNVHITRRLQLLSSILDDRLRVKIREQLGGAYSPEAASEPSDAFTQYGMLVAEIDGVAPARADEIRQSILDLAADMAAHGVTADQLDRAKQPVLTSLRDSARTNQYWLGAVLGSCQEFPQRLDWARSRYTDVQSVTQAELDALARQYLGAARAFQVVVSPQAAPKTSDALVPPNP